VTAPTRHQQDVIRYLDGGPYVAYSLYTIRRLLQADLIKPRLGPGFRRYELTEAGRQWLADHPEES
jgi:DNA-binding PadR family transcriptional regulator